MNVVHDTQSHISLFLSLFRHRPSNEVNGRVLYERVAMSLDVVARISPIVLPLEFA